MLSGSAPHASIIIIIIRIIISISISVSISIRGDLVGLVSAPGPFGN